MMASEPAPAPQTEQPNPPIDGRSSDALPKPNNSLELGWEPLSSGANEGLHLRLGMLPAP
jgi:hypothetical protein